MLQARALGRSFRRGNGNRNHLTQTGAIGGFETDDRAGLSVHSHLLLLQKRLLLLTKGAEVVNRVLDLCVGELALERRHLPLAVGCDAIISASLCPSLRGRWPA